MKKSGLFLVRIPEKILGKSCYQYLCWREGGRKATKGGRFIEHVLGVRENNYFDIRDKSSLSF